MLGGPTVKQLWELAGQQHSIRAIARELRLSRNTVRKYLRAPGIPRYTSRPPRPSKLDAYRDHIRTRLAAGVENAVVLLRELRAQGYTGSYTILKSYLQPLRLRRAVTATMRFETKPGEQAQVDFGRFPFLTASGQRQWLWGCQRRW
jgi:transposase